MFRHFHICYESSNSIKLLQYLKTKMCFVLYQLMVKSCPTEMGYIDRRSLNDIDVVRLLAIKEAVIITLFRLTGPRNCSGYSRVLTSASLSLSLSFSLSLSLSLSVSLSLSLCVCLSLSLFLY